VSLRIEPGLNTGIPVASSAVASSRGLLGGLLERKGRVGRLMKIFVFFPTLLVFFYLSLLHSDMYLSRSVFAVRTGGLNPVTEGGGIGALLSSYLPGGSSGSDSQIVLAYIASEHMLAQVAAELDLRGHYADHSHDFWSRLRENPTREEMLAYWRWLVKPSFDFDKSVISVEVKAYTPEMATALGRAVLHFSEALVNDMNLRAKADALRLAAEEVARAEKRVVAAADAMRRFRDTKALLDPAMAAQGLETVIVGLETEAAKTRAELDVARSVMRRDSLKVAEIQNRLNSVNAQIAREKSRLASLDAGKSKNALSSLVGDYRALLLEEEFANKQLVAAMSTHEAARIQATIQSRYIVPIEPPTLAEEAEYPRPFLFTLVAFAGFMTVLGLVSLTVAAVRDHMGV
jgi:capsular polysaccharide transport system permease protein